MRGVLPVAGGKNALIFEGEWMTKRNPKAQALLSLPRLLPLAHTLFVPHRGFPQLYTLHQT